jgi:hypothetical protein
MCAAAQKAGEGGAAECIELVDTADGKSFVGGVCRIHMFAGRWRSSMTGVGADEFPLPYDRAADETASTHSHLTVRRMVQLD